MDKTNSSNSVESQLEVTTKINKKLKREELIARETIHEKNAIIHQQRIKIKQCEFAIQEALQFLGTPLNKYQEWLNNEVDNEFILEQGPVNLKKRFSDGSRTKPRTSNYSLHSVTSLRKSASLPFGKSFSTESLGMSRLEVTTLEYMRLCYVFLKNCQIHNTAIDNGTYQVPMPGIPDFQSLDKNRDEGFGSDISISKLPSLPSSKVPNQQHDPLDDIQDEIPQIRLKSRSSHNFRQNNQKQSSSDEKSEYINELEQRLRKEIKARKIIQRAKDLLDQEIENITAELFARANQMVVDESKKVDQISLELKHTKKQLKDTSEKLLEKESLLAEAAETIYHSQPNGGFQNVALTADSQDSSKSNEHVQFVHTIISGFESFKPRIAADGYVFLEFQEFMKTLRHTPMMESSIAYAAIHNSQFMKRCMNETIEPCLFYEYSRQKKLLSFTTKRQKRLLDGCIQGTIIINSINSLQDQLSPSSAVNKAACGSCEVTRDCEYTLLLEDAHYSEKLCRFCRDRIVTVQDFFNYITFLANNANRSSSSNSVMNTFRRMLWFRRRIALALLGSCSLYETEVTSVRGPQIDDSWEKYCDII